MIKGFLYTIAIISIIAISAFWYGITQFEPCAYWQPNMDHREKKLTALRFVNHVGPMTVVQKPRLESEPANYPVDYIPIENISEFLDENPECCVVHGYRNWSDRIPEGSEHLSRTIYPERPEFAFTGEPDSDLQPGSEGIVVVRLDASYNTKNGSVEKFKTFSDIDFQKCDDKNYSPLSMIVSFIGVGFSKIL